MAIPFSVHQPSWVFPPSVIQASAQPAGHQSEACSVMKRVPHCDGHVVAGPWDAIGAVSKQRALSPLGSDLGSTAQA